MLTGDGVTIMAKREYVVKETYGGDWDSPELRCPMCAGVLEPGVYQVREDKTNMRLCLEASHVFENSLRRCIRRYWQWCAEGKSEQQAYDLRHNNVQYDPATDTYTFSIQTKDSPEGDAWLSGRFRLNGRRIEILEEE